MPETLTEIPAGADLVLTLDWDISEEQEDQIRRKLQQQLPGRNLVILPKGVRLSPAVSFGWANRLEAKLDQLLRALAEEAGDDEPGLDLDGFMSGAPRAEGQSLG